MTSLYKTESLRNLRNVFSNLHLL